MQQQQNHYNYFSNKTQRYTCFLNRLMGFRNKNRETGLMKYSLLDKFGFRFWTTFLNMSEKNLIRILFFLEFRLRDVFNLLLPSFI